MPMMVSGMPTGEISNRLNGSRPCWIAAPLATMLVEVPIRLQVPPSTVA
jgi:hypothetical protein